MSGRVVVVTGSAGGIGSAIVQRFEQLGDTAVGLDLADGFDIADPQQCQQAAARIVQQHGRIDVLCNNAGISAVGDVVQSTPDDWQRVFAVNVFGIANLSRAVIPHMREAGGGAIVNTCSIVAHVGLVQRAVYGASKGAVLAMTKAMAADEVQHGIRVNCVSPGTVESPWVQRLIASNPQPEAAYDALRRRQPMGDLVSCEAVADAVVYLAAPTTFTTGVDLLVDGGISGVRIVT
jgi:NAD(P)-dependent dehydrogenase (short-subunit alcohol dehydrogenase family)